MIRRTAIAIILSIIIAGLGQIYLGYIKRGVIILIAGFAISFFMTFWLGLWGLFPALAFWIWNIYDANKLSKNPATVKA
jgi:TM2 domain-containing membrane protein YozV